MELYVELAVGVLVTLAGSYMFTEWAEGLGGRLRLKSAVLGGIVSPVFTSLPEFSVIIVSLVYYRGVGGSEVSLGTIMGEPLVITTLVVPVETFVTLIQWKLGLRRRPSLGAGNDVRPLTVLILVMPSLLAGSLISASWLRALISSVLILVYLYYGYVTSRSPGLIPESKEWASGPRGAVTLAAVAVASLALIYYGSVTLVNGVLRLSRSVGVPAVEVSALLVPAATALPESLTSIIWVGRGSDELGVSALLGEVTLYATVYPALGMLVTSWRLNTWALASLAATEASVTSIVAQAARSRQIGSYQAAFILVFVALAAAMAEPFRFPRIQ